MIKQIKLVILIIILLSFVRIVYVLINDNNVYKEESKKVIGIITNIRKAEDKTIIDVKEKSKYRITIYDDVNYDLGDKISVSGTFTNPSNNTVFNLFNYRKYLLTKKIKMISSNPKIILVSKNKNILYSLKNKIMKYVEKYKTSAYLKAFVLGDTTSIEDVAMKGYRNIGVSHLFAISGMHASVFLSLINILFKKFKYKDILIFILLLLFLFLTNYAESLLRCSLFLLLSYINKKLDLRIKNINILILTAFTLLIINPYLIYSVGFMFSVVITFFVILSNYLLRDKNYFHKLLIVSVICFLASIPILACNFFKINFLSILFNLLFVPLVSIVIFPLGLITFIFPALDSFYLLFINLLEYLVVNLDKIKILSFVIAKPNILIIILYYLFLYLSIKVDKRYIVLYVIILIFNINTRFLIFNPEIIFLDVGQGDSTIVILPRGKTVLIDTGGNLLSKLKVVENKTIPYLNSRGIDKIDLLILTHGDYDHMGEAITLVNNLKIKNVVFNNDELNELESKLIKTLDQKDINYYQNVEELNINDNKLYFLNNKLYDNENDNSNVIYFDNQGYKMLFMADVGIEVEKDIISKYNLEEIDILKVGHHGSKTSTSKEFIREVNPKYGIISVGKSNKYGHPNNEVLETLKNSVIYRTDKNGSISFKLNKNKLKIKTCEP